MACTAILAALDDAGLSIKDLDGFAIYSNSCDPAANSAHLHWNAVGSEENCGAVAIGVNCADCCVRVTLSSSA